MSKLQDLEKQLEEAKQKAQQFLQSHPGLKKQSAALQERKKGLDTDKKQLENNKKQLDVYNKQLKDNKKQLQDKEKHFQDYKRQIEDYSKKQNDLESEIKEKEEELIKLYELHQSLSDVIRKPFLDYIFPRKDEIDKIKTLVLQLHLKIEQLESMPKDNIRIQTLKNQLESEIKQLSADILTRETQLKLDDENFRKSSEYQEYQILHKAQRDLDEQIKFVKSTGLEMKAVGLEHNPDKVTDKNARALIAADHLSVIATDKAWKETFYRLNDYKLNETPAKIEFQSKVYPAKITVEQYGINSKLPDDVSLKNKLMLDVLEVYVKSLGGKMVYAHRITCGDQEMTQLAEKELAKKFVESGLKEFKINNKDQTVLLAPEQAQTNTNGTNFQVSSASEEPPSPRPSM